MDGPLRSGPLRLGASTERLGGRVRDAARCINITSNRFMNAASLGVLGENRSVGPCDKSLAACPPFPGMNEHHFLCVPSKGFVFILSLIHI